MEWSDSNESVSKESEDSFNRVEPVEEPNQKDESGGSSGELNQKKLSGPAEKSKPVDQPSSSVSDFDQGDKNTSSEEKMATRKILPEPDVVTEPTSTRRLDVDEPMILNLSEIELVSISSTIAEANERYLLEQSGETSREADEVKESEEVVQRPAGAEARQHEVLEQKDSVLSESGAEGFDFAMHCGASGNGENEEQIKLLRSRVIIGLLSNELSFFQQLRFNSELLMHFLLERRDMADDDKLKYDSPNSPSIPRFDIRPLVPGVSEPMDELRPILANFIRRTKDFMSKYRQESPDCDEKALKDYLDLFFGLQERLERLEDVLRNVSGKYAFRSKLNKEISGLENQSTALHKILEHAHFMLGKVLYMYRNRLREM